MDKDIILLKKLGEGCKAAPRLPGRPGDVFGASRKCLQRTQKGDSSEWPYLNKKRGPGKGTCRIYCTFCGAETRKDMNIKSKFKQGH